MGILADFFIATPMDAPEYEKYLQREETPPAARFEVEQSGRLTSLEISGLWAIIEGKEHDFGRHSLNTIYHPDGEERDTWLERFPPALVKLLSDIPDADLDAVAEKWGQLEEIGEDGAEMRPTVEALRRLARRAIETERLMYLWGSL